MDAGLVEGNPMTCGNCKHAVAVDPDGHWARHGFTHVDYIHCGVSKLERHCVIWKRHACSFKPSKWEAHG